MKGASRTYYGSVASPQLRGQLLENRVYNLLKKAGKRNIRKNVLVRDSNGNLSEIDIMFGYLFPQYVECKAYESSVGLEQVAKFKEVLNLLGIPLRRYDLALCQLPFLIQGVYLSLHRHLSLEQQP